MVVNLNLVIAKILKPKLLPLLKKLKPRQPLLKELQQSILNHLLKVNVVKDMVNVPLVNFVVNMVGVIKQKIIVPPKKVVKVNMENVNKIIN